MSYVLAGNKIYDSQELLEQIKAHSRFKSVKDLTRGSKREDTLIYQIVQDAAEVKAHFLTQEQEAIGKEELAGELMELADERLAELEALIPPVFLIHAYSYAYDEQQAEIKGILVAIDEEVGELRLKDVVERILRSLD